MKASGPSVCSEHLELRPLDAADQAPLLALLSLEPVRRYLLDGNVPEPDWIASLVSDARADFARRGLGLWSARRRGDPELVGLVGFRDFYEPPVEELIYALHPDAWGQGLATEMARAAVDHAFAVAGRDRVRASTDVPNRASIAVLERLDFRESGRDAPEGLRWEQVHFALERDDWRPAGAAALAPHRV